MRKLKRAAVLLLSALMVFGILPIEAAAAPVDFGSVQLGQEYVKVSKTPSGKAGQKVSVKFSVYNPEGSDMEDATIELLNEQEFKNALELDDSDEEGVPVNSEYPFEYEEDMFEEKSLGTIHSKKTKGYSRSYKLRRDLKEGYYPAVFRLRYNGGNYVDFGVNIWVSISTGTTEDEENNKIDYDFAMGEGQSTPYASYTEVMNFGVNLRNSGLKKVYDVRVSMQLDADTAKFPFDINDGNYDRAMGDMEAGQTVSVPYSMAVREDVKSGFYPVAFKIVYREENGGDFISTPVDKVFYVRVRGEDDEELSADAGENERTKARIIVESFTTDPVDVYAGNVFTLHVRMKNASSNVRADNIMFTFASEEVDSSPIFTTESGSTSLVVNQLAPGASTDLKLQFQSSPTAEQKSYVMTIKEQYDSPEFKNAKEEVKISIPVKQKPRLNTGTIEVMPDTINVGSESNIMFGINNTGKVLLYNVMARFEGASIQTTDAYVGNIKPGETGNVDAMITGAAPTADSGKIKIIISFEDENGTVTEIEKEMSLMVTEAMPEDFGETEAGNMDVEGAAPEQSFFAKYKIPVIAAAAIALIAAVAAVVLRKKKKKAAEEEGMDDEIL